MNIRMKPSLLLVFNVLMAHGFLRMRTVMANEIVPEKAGKMNQTNVVGLFAEFAKLLLETS